MLSWLMMLSSFTILSSLISGSVTNSGRCHQPLSKLRRTSNFSRLEWLHALSGKSRLLKGSFVRYLSTSVCFLKADQIRFWSYQERSVILKVQVFDDFLFGFLTSMPHEILFHSNTETENWTPAKIVFMHQKGALFVQQQETWSLNTRYFKKLITVRNITKTIPNSAFCWNAHPFWFQEVQKKCNLLLLEYTFPVRKPPSFDFKCLNSEKIYQI